MGEKGFALWERKTAIVKRNKRGLPWKLPFFLAYFIHCLFLFCRSCLLTKILKGVFMWILRELSKKPLLHELELYPSLLMKWCNSLSGHVRSTCRSRVMEQGSKLLAVKSLKGGRTISRVPAALWSPFFSRYGVRDDILIHHAEHWWSHSCGKGKRLWKWLSMYFLFFNKMISHFRRSQS